MVTIINPTIVNKGHIYTNTISRNRDQVCAMKVPEGSVTQPCYVQLCYFILNLIGTYYSVYIYFLILLRWENKFLFNWKCALYDRIRLNQTFILTKLHFTKGTKLVERPNSIPIPTWIPSTSSTRLISQRLYYWQVWDSLTNTQTGFPWVPPASHSSQKTLIEDISIQDNAVAI